MKKKKITPSFIHSLKLSPDEYQKDIIETSLNVGRQLYNNGLGELLKRRELMINSKLYKNNNKLYKEFKKQEKILKNNPKLKLTNKIKKSDITKIYNKISKDFGFSDFSIQSYLIKQKNVQFKKLLGSDETQKVATRVWNSVSDFHFGDKGKPHFKRFGDFYSLEGKSSKSTLRFKDGKCIFLKQKIKVIYDLVDKYNIQSQVLSSRVKYSRIYKEIIRGKSVYFLQLIVEGIPLTKPQHKTPKYLKDNTICFDLGPQSIGIVSKTGKYSQLNVLLPEIDRISLKRQKIQKQLSKKLRLNNPEFFETNKIIKKKSKNKDGSKKKNIKIKQKFGKIIKSNEKRIWNNSKKYLDLKKTLSELFRKETLKREELHNRSINQILLKGNNFNFEKLSYVGWQKLFGRSVGSKSPGLFVEKLKYKVKKVNGKILEINTRRTKLSQTCVCGKIKKKKLSERFHVCDSCGNFFQRDMLSAYLGLFVKLDKDKNQYIDIVEAEKSLPRFEQSLNNAVLKYQTVSTSSLKTLGFSKSELERFALLISDKKTSVSLNIVSRNTESQDLGSKVQSEPLYFSIE